MEGNDGFKNNILVAIVFMVIAWLIIDQIFGISKGRREEKERQERTQAGQAVQVDELAALIIKGIKPSFTANHYAQLAEKLFNSMVGGGTDEADLASSLLQLQNDADYLVLTRAFGKRKGADGISRNLIGWLQTDTGNAFRAEINRRWTTKGITYKI